MIIFITVVFIAYFILYKTLSHKIDNRDATILHLCIMAITIILYAKNKIPF